MISAVKKEILVEWIDKIVEIYFSKFLAHFPGALFLFDFLIPI